MVKVIKNDKKVQGFKAAKIVNSCKKAGMPEPIPKAVAQIVSKKVKGKKTITSKAITTIIFDVCNKMGKIPAGWSKHNKTKKKTTAKKK